MTGMGSSKVSKKYRLSEDDFFTALKSLDFKLRPSEVSLYFGLKI